MPTKVKRSRAATPDKKPVKKKATTCTTCQHPQSFHPKTSDSPSANRGKCLVGGCKCTRFRIS